MIQLWILCALIVTMIPHETCLVHTRYFNCYLERTISGILVFSYILYRAMDFGIFKQSKRSKSNLGCIFYITVFLSPKSQNISIDTTYSE